MKFSPTSILLLGIVAITAQAQSNGQLLVHRGAVDGSAGAAIDDKHFVAATDEDSTLRVYRRDVGGDPVQTLNLTSFLELEKKSPETDIEAAARVGQRIYWITSHGCNKNGKAQPNRQRFFATDIVTKGTNVTLVPAGRPYKSLLRDLLAVPQLAEFKLAAGAALAPKVIGALNIEGLAATPGQGLLIGFRNPTPGRRALVVPLLNPDGLIEGQPAKFGAPLLLDLGGLGIRDFTLVQRGYVIVAGPIDGDGSFQLFRWAGGDSQPVPLQKTKLGSLRPEAVLTFADRTAGELLLLSDDSSQVEERNGNSLPAQFRSQWLKLK